MICSKCGSENSDESLFCNRCGAKLVETNNAVIDKEEVKQDTIEDKESNAEKSELNVKNKKITKNKIILTMISILIIAGCFVGYKYYDNHKKTEEAKKYHEKYELTFAKTTLDILTETCAAQLMCSQISDTWRNAIDSSYKDFNTEIANQQKQWQDKGVLKERETAKNNIEKNMKELRNPPKDYEEAYKLFVDLYSIYGQVYSQAISPQGSIITYNQDVNQKSSEFSQIYDKIKVLEPDIETKAKKK
ncbi:zinc ribbon domain-containing protein [Haloimpatiens sp. FM7315]|uniref:zinc ribbon domain-containing protein n=1 Tax=Haloimpatiens sp. FM7315 TaxID=3298609 RepID=UPI0035A36D88